MTFALDSASAVRRSPHQVSCRLDDEVAILDLRSALYFGVDAIGAPVWEALETPCSVSSPCDEVAHHFHVAPESCRADIEGFLTQLRKGD